MIGGDSVVSISAYFSLEAFIADIASIAGMFGKCVLFKITFRVKFRGAIEAAMKAMFIGDVLRSVSLMSLDLRFINPPDRTHLLLQTRGRISSSTGAISWISCSVYAETLGQRRKHLGTEYMKT